MRIPASVITKLKLDAAARAVKAAVSLKNSLTAPINLISVPKTPIKKNSDTPPPTDSSNIGESSPVAPTGLAPSSKNVIPEAHDISVDQINLETKQKIVKASQLIISQKKQQTTIQSSAISPLQKIRQLTSAIVEDQNAKKSALISLQRLQRVCRHKYDVTGRCIFCSKSKDSHVYDTVKNSILSQVV